MIVKSVGPDEVEAQALIVFFAIGFVYDRHWEYYELVG